MFAMTCALMRGLRPTDIETIEKITRLAFPGVPHLSTNELERSLSHSARLILIDVRSPAEFAISHLKDAINLRSVEEIAKRCSDRNAKLVLYCAVGFRSARLVSKLQKRGFRNPVNLEGSIFRWINEGRPVYSGAALASSVHPFGSMWSGLLKRGSTAKI
ncbi:MAG: Rhodanese domain protein [Verrucomicrobiales bacterium]|nr:Rhodanese domain protein [Verrucomicrobiales bacterium]